MLFDPFLFPGSLREEYDPLIHPEKYISHTIKCLYFWFSLSPWIFEGILKIIRSPADFDLKLRYKSIKAEEARVQKHPELQQKLKQLGTETDLNYGEFGWFTDYMRLAISDEQVMEILKSKEFSDEEISSFMKYRAGKKENHPYYTEQRHNEVFVTKMGECIGVERMVANLSGAFLLTDSDFRWSLIRIERQNEQIDESAWEPFANAVTKAPLKYISNLTLEDCLRLRKDGLLHRMRSFMRRVWANARIAEDFTLANAQQFAAELDQEIAIAEEEWRKIDSRFLKWFAGESAAALVAAPQIDYANVGWVAASLGILGAANLGDAHMKRKSLKKRMPCAFFLGIRSK
jgi:hypothetical protein